MTQNKEIRWLLLTTALALLAATVALAAAIPAVGSKAPEFTLPSQEGAMVSLKDFKGKWVVLYFYPKDFTQGCTIEAHNFQEDQPKYTALNAAIVGISADSVESHKEFCTKENLTFKTLADPSGKVIDQYGSLTKLEGAMKERFKQDHIAARNTFLIDPDGVVRKVYTNVNPAPHSKEVLADLATLVKK
jgi:peroxiredoxin Q/BCP